MCYVTRDFLDDENANDVFTASECSRDDKQAANTYMIQFVAFQPNFTGVRIHANDIG